MRVLLIFTLISYTFCDAPYKPHLEAKIVMNKNMFRSYSGDSKPANVKFEITIPLKLAQALGLLLENQNALRTHPLPNSQSNWPRDLRAVPELVNYLLKSSQVRLQSIIEKYYKVLIKGGTHVEIAPEVNATLSVYKLNFHKHINELLKEDPRNQFEKDLILLDIIDTSSSLLYEGTLICLQIMIDRQFSKGSTNIKTVTDEIFKKTLRKKKQDLKLLCNMTGICRPFPGISEYLVDLLDEIIKLPDSKLHTVVMKTMMTVENKQEDIVHALGKDLVDNLGKRLQILMFDELAEIRKAITQKRKDILERYRWKKLTERSKAFRIFLDMLDKAFVMNRTDKVAEQFAITIKELRDWKSGATIDIGQVLSTFFNYVLKTFTANCGYDAHKEARTLIQIHIDGHTDNQTRYQYLLSNGSNYVNKFIL